MIAPPGSTLWLLRHDLRLAGRDFRSSGRGKGRVVAFILFCIGVQIAWNGLAVLLAGVIRP